MLALDEIVERGRIEIAIYGDFPPCDWDEGWARTGATRMRQPRRSLPVTRSSTTRFPPDLDLRHPDHGHALQDRGRGDDRAESQRGDGAPLPQFKAGAGEGMAVYAPCCPGSS